MEFEFIKQVIIQTKREMLIDLPVLLDLVERKIERKHGPNKRVVKERIQIKLEGGEANNAGCSQSGGGPNKMGRL